MTVFVLENNFSDDCTYSFDKVLGIFSSKEKCYEYLQENYSLETREMYGSGTKCEHFVFIPKDWSSFGDELEGVSIKEIEIDTNKVISCERVSNHEPLKTASEKSRTTMSWL